MTTVASDARTAAFPPQLQDPPGRTALMDPLPDHGELSYRGSGRLTGLVLLASEGDASYVSGTVVGVTGGQPVF